MSELVGYRAQVLDYAGDPRTAPEHVRYVEDGLLLVRDGVIVAAGAHSELARAYPAAHVHDYRGTLVLPGFVDAHVHFAQLRIIASHGEQLLEWLERYVFPEEALFADPAHGARLAALFLRELLQSGTTSALVLGTIHPESIDALAEAALARDLRLVLGKMLMDRNAPPGLCESPELGQARARELARRWHGRGRLEYAIVPRFAPTSSPRQLELTAELAAELPSARIHSHLAENAAEVAWVRELFPDARDYTDVYDRFGLVDGRASFAHGVQLSEAELERLSARGASLVFCPSANLFLGSGLLPYARVRASGVTLGIGTDVGAGTSLCVLRALADGYKVLSLQGQRWSAHEALYLATLGGARALGIDRHVGSLEPGKEADFVVHDLEATPLLALRAERAESLDERLFAFVTLGDERTVRATYVRGQLAYERPRRA